MTIGSPPRATAKRQLLDDGRGARAMRWVMAVMLFLTGLAAAAGLATAQASAAIDRQLGGRLVIQLIGGDPQAQRVAAALVGSPGVAAVAVVPRAELAELVRPWLGDAGLDAGLPMPAMIDVEMADTRAPAIDAVAARVRAIAPGARLDRSVGWLAPVRRFVLTLGWLAGGLVLLMISATASIVLLAARAGLDTHRDTIEVLHMLGSTDHQIARLFQRRVALDTLVGGVAGTTAALAVALLIGAQARALDTGLASGVALAMIDWALLAALPLLFAVLATLAARIAVLRALRRAP